MSGSNFNHQQVTVFQSYRMAFIGLLILLSGCAIRENDITAERETSSSLVLVGSDWRVESINQQGIIDNSMGSMRFYDADQRVSGTTGCNRFSGAFELDQNSLVMTRMISTRKACVPALMNQEQRFLSTLSAITQARTNKNGLLILLDTNANERLRLIAMSNKE